ncbi:hypothetical protein [Pseudaestuariivita sp.]|uniref:hypothetical protein n=1 Tax=Pseudaestuariivita sp. TaxID=2211669 RepID=UPI0040592475
MKKFALAAAVAALTAGAAQAGGGHGHGHGHSHGHGHGHVVQYGGVAHSGVTIKVVCWRGPLKKVWVDKPKDVFINTLMAAGLSANAATNVAYSVCRHPGLVNNPAGLRAETIRLYNQYRRGW